MKALLLSVFVAASLLSFSGCVTTDANRPAAAVAYTSLETTWRAALAIYREYADLAARGLVKPEDQRDIDKAWNNFRDALRVAVVASSRGFSAATPSDVEILKNDLVVLIKSL